MLEQFWVAMESVRIDGVGNIQLFRLSWPSCIIRPLNEFIWCCRYRDPKTGLPYATKEAFKIIRQRYGFPCMRVNCVTLMGFFSLQGVSFCLVILISCSSVMFDIQFRFVYNFVVLDFQVSTWKWSGQERDGPGRFARFTFWERVFGKAEEISVVK